MANSTNETNMKDVNAIIVSDDIKFKVKGSFLIHGQYHYTMETQTCYCIPTEDGFDVYSATQWPTTVQLNICAILKIPMNR